jgi:hypothetical protein
MPLLLPSQSSLAAPSTWIHPRDTAIDSERVGRETLRLAELAEAEARHRLGLGDAKLTPAQEALVRAETERLGLPWQHPLTRWMRGETRYNIDAPMHVAEGLGLGPTVTMRDYLTGDPVLFVLRPLSARERCRIDPLLARSTETGEGYRLAVKCGVVGIENGKADALEWSEDPLGGLAESVIDRLALVPRALMGLGGAVLRISTIDLDVGKP